MPETHCHRVWQSPRLSGDEHTLGRFRRTWLIVAKFVSLHADTDNLSLVDVQPLRYRRVQQFVSRGCLRARKPEICALVGVARAQTQRE